MIKIIYNSPAMPQYPYDVQLGVSYECQKIKDKYIVKGVNFERAFSLKFIQNMFKLCDGYTWDMLGEKVAKENATKNTNSDKANKK